MRGRLSIYCGIIVALSSISIIAMDITLPVKQQEMNKAEIFFDLVKSQETKKVPLKEVKNLFPQFAFNETKKEHRIVQCLIRYQVSTADVSDYPCSMGEQNVMWTPYSWWLNDNEDTESIIVKPKFLQPLSNEVKFLYPRIEKAKMRQLIADKIEQELLNIKEQDDNKTFGIRFASAHIVQVTSQEAQKLCPGFQFDQTQWMIPTVIADVSHKCSVNENDIVWVPDAWVWNDDTTIECIVNPDFPILPDAQFQLRKCFHSKKTLEVFYCYGKAKMRARVANLIERHLQNALNEQKDNFLAAIKQQDEKIDEITKTSNSHNIRANTNFTNLQNEQSAHKETLWFYRHLCAGTFFVCLAGFIAYIYLKTLKTQRVFR